MGEEGLGDLRGAKALVAEHDLAAFVAVEGTMLDTITVGAVGSLRYRVTVRGPGGHSWGDRGAPSAIHALIRMLDAGHVACHAFVLGEISLGTLKHRDLVLGLLAELPTLQVARHDDVRTLIDRHRLWGRGIGWIDAHLLTSVRLADARLWTRDRRLAEVARELDADGSVP